MQALSHLSRLETGSLLPGSYSPSLSPTASRTDRRASRAVGAFCFTITVLQLLTPPLRGTGARLLSGEEAAHALIRTAGAWRTRKSLSGSNRPDCCGSGGRSRAVGPAAGGAKAGWSLPKNAATQRNYSEEYRGHVGFNGVLFNVLVRGHPSGLDKVQHREFVMASGEMSRPMSSFPHGC